MRQRLKRRRRGQTLPGGRFSPEEIEQRREELDERLARIMRRLAEKRQGHVAR
jgi:hypothetical protein